MLLPFLSPTSQGFSPPPYHTYFTGSTFATAKILSTFGSLYLSACFVCRWLSFRRCLLFYPLITLRLHHTPYIRHPFSSPLLSFWFESLLSIIAVSFEFQSSPPLHCYIMQLFSPCQAVTVNGGFAHRHPPTYRAVLFRCCFSLAYHIFQPPSLSQFQRFNNSISPLFSVASSTLASYLAIFALLLGLSY